jgi:CDP-paratose 2-epimerase
MKKILITGGCGFVGSNLAIALKRKYADYHIISFDNLKRRGSELNIPRLKEEGIEFRHGDIRNKEDFEGFEELDFIIDASAEPSVLAGLDGTPDYLVHTNFNGTVNCLNLAKKTKAAFIFLSTSRVYPINQIEQIEYQETNTRFSISNQQQISGIGPAGIDESFPLEGYRSLYGATKLASELMIAEYQQLLGVPTVINRCGVLTGPYQMGKVDQGVIVLWLARHFWKKDLGYFGFGGEGKQVRDILHIDDLFELIDYQINNFEKINGQTFNVGGGKDISVSLRELTMICEEVTGNRININKVPETRAADIRIYITNNEKVTNLTNWEPKIKPHQIIEDIFHWLRKNEKSLKPILY